MSIINLTHTCFTHCQQQESRVDHPQASEAMDSGGAAQALPEPDLKTKTPSANG